MSYPISWALILCLLPLPATAGASSPLPADPLGPPPLWDGIGNSSMKITTRSPEAQRYFDQGLNLMHGYWSFEARRSFQQAIRLDPLAPMAYWGLFMSTTFNLGEHRGDRQWAIDKMEELRSHGDDRERSLIDAILRLAGRGEGGGPAGFLAEMEDLVARQPHDPEIRLVLIKFLIEVSTHERGLAARPRPFGRGRGGHRPRATWSDAR